MQNNNLGFEPIEDLSDDKFAKAAEFTFRDDIEGGYTVDHAGATKYGITQTTLDAFNKKHGYPTVKVSEITLDDAKYVAKKMYFDEPNFGNLPTDVSAIMFDYGFNASPLKATKTLQSIVGAKTDGQLGPKTLEAVNKYVSKYGEKTLAKNIVDKRADHYKSLINSNPNKYKKYEGGWMNRINKIKDSFQLSSLLGVSTAHADELPADYGDIGFEPEAQTEVKKNEYDDLGFEPSINAGQLENDFSDLGFEPETMQSSVEKKAQDFSDLALRDMSQDEISQAKPKGIKEHIKAFFRQSPEASVAKAQNIYAISKSTGMPILEVEKNYEALSRDPRVTGIKPEINNEEYMTAIMTPMLVAGALTNPVGTAVGVAAFAGLDKLIPTKDFIPSDASDTTRSAIELADFIAKGAIVGGVMKAGPRVVEAFTKQKIESYNLPKDIFLTPEQVKDIFQTGKLTTPEQVSAFASLNLSRDQLKTAIKEGISFPIEKIVTIADKPWYAKFKEALGIKPSEKILSRETIQRPPIRGLLESPEQQALTQQQKPSMPPSKFPEAEKVGKVVGIDAETKLPIIDTRQAASQPASPSQKPSEMTATPLQQPQGGLNEKSQGQETSKEMLGSEPVKPVAKPATTPQEVYQDIKDNLIANGIPEEQADANAKLWQARAIQASRQQGISVEQWYEKNRPTIARSDAKAPKEALKQSDSIPTGNEGFDGKKQIETKTGSPVKLRSYHGTIYNFDKFTINNPNLGKRGSYSGKGIYFTPNKTEASAFTGDNGRIIESILDMKNPYVVYLPEGNIDKDLSGVAESAKKNGHDAMIVRLRDTASEDWTGKDGVFHPKGEVESDWIKEIVVFDENIIKSMESPTFFSQAERVIDEKMPNAATPEMIKGILSDKNGVKAEELKWLGLDDFLAGKQKVTKQELKDFITQNQVEIKEVEKSNNPIPDNAFKDDNAQKYFNVSYNDLNDIQKKYIDDLLSNEQFISNERPTKFQQYQLPGGNNYRELLLTLPSQEKFDSEKVEIIRNRRSVTQGTVTLKYDGKDLGTWDDSGNVDNNYQRPNAELIDQARRLFFGGDHINGVKSTVPSFRSSHFDEPNILAHVRMNDRVDADGKKVLFVEEVQSDWHQKGRKEGYQDAQRQLEYDAKMKELSNQELEIADKQLAIRKKFAELILHWTQNNAGDYVANVRGHKLIITPEGNKFYIYEDGGRLGRTAETLSQAKDYGMQYVTRDLSKQDLMVDKEYVELQEKSNEISNKIKKLNDEYKDVKGVPDAPFKKSWHELAMKRMLRYASENGYDKLAWTTGEQQNERYKLSKQVDYIDWASKTVPQTGELGKGLFIATKDNQSFRVTVNNAGIIISAPPISGGGVLGKELSDVIGKGLAEKIMSEEKGSLAGEKLDLGTSGMKGFYDQILPSFMNKYAKKWGAKVETGQLDIPRNVGGKGEQVYLPNDRRDVAFVHSVNITPSMRDSVMQGQPLFQNGARGWVQLGKSNQNKITLSSQADASTFIHESAHIWLEDIHSFAKKTPTEDWKILSKWLGVKDGQESLTRQQHERFARGFEKYLGEGQSPNESLKSVFDKFKEWLLNIYKSLQNLRVNLSKGVKGVFDRMLAEPKIEPKKEKKTSPVSLISEIRKSGGISLKSAVEAGYTYKDFKEFGLISVLNKNGGKLDSIASELISRGIIQNPNNDNPSDLLMQTLKYNKNIIQKKVESLETDYDKEFAEWEANNKKEPAYAEIQESDIAGIEANIEKEISSQEAQGLDWTDNPEPPAVINKAYPSNEIQPESNLTPSGQVRPEMLPPEMKSLFQEEGEMFRGNSGIDASTGSPSIDQYEPSGNSKDKTAAFKLSDKVVALVKKYAERFGENYNPSGSAGAFFRSTNNIFVQAKNDVGVAAHEVTHYLDKKIGFTQKIMIVKGFAKNGNPIYDSSTKETRKELTGVYTKYYPGGKKDHPLNTRIKEGIAVFVQRMVTHPVQTAREFPSLKRDFLVPSGKYFDELIPSFVSEARTIVEEYQKLSDLDKIKARVVDAEVMKDEPFLNIQETAIYKNIDNKYPLEKLAKEAGEHFKNDDPSLIARVYDHIPMLIQHNLSDSAFIGLGPWGFGKETFLTMKGNGEIYKKYDYNWHTLVNKVGNDLEDFNGWLVARRIVQNYKNFDIAKERFKEKAAELKEARDAGIEPDAEGMKELIQEALNAKKKFLEAQSLVNNDRFDRDVATRAYDMHKERFKDNAKMFDDLVKADLELVHESGMISDSRYQDLISEEGYASFKRQIENEIVGTGEGAGAVRSVKVGRNKVSSLFRYGGSGKDIISPVYSSMENHQEIMKKITRQIVYNSVGRIADKFPELFQKVPLKSYKEDTGKIIYPQDKDQNIMMAYTKGVRVPYVVNKDLKMMMDAMLTPANVGLTEKVFVGLAQAFTKGTTAMYIPFAATNFVIDQLSAASNSWTKFKPIYTPISELVKVLSNRDSIDAKYAMEYFMLGGERQAYLSFADLNPKEAYEFMRSEKGAIDKAIEILNAGGDILATPVKTTELLTRMSEFIRARKEGYGQLASLELAGRISTPFHHRGQKGDIYRFLTRSIPYLNASIQVLAQEARSLKNPKSRYRALFIMAAISTAAIVGVSMLLQSTDDQKELLKGLSVDRLNKFVYLPSPDGETLIKIRVPQEKMAFANVFNMAMIDAQLNAKYSAYEYLRGATGWIPDQLNPTDMGRMLASWIPQAVSPSLQVAFNVKLYPQIRQLEPDYMKVLPKDERVFENSSSMAKWLAPKIGLSPIQFDSLIEGYTGRSLRYISGREIGNPFQEKMYLSSSRQLIGFYAEREKNNLDYSKLKDNPKSFSIDESRDIRTKHNKINMIEKELTKYRKVTKENKNDPDLRDLRTRILDKIDSL